MDKKPKKATQPKGTDRRDFFKTAAKMAGVLAAVSAVGAEKAQGQVPERLIAGTQLKLNKGERKKQFGISSVELGRVLQAEGFIPAGVRNLEKAALHVSVSW